MSKPMDVVDLLMLLLSALSPFILLTHGASLLENVKALTGRDPVTRVESRLTVKYRLSYPQRAFRELDDPNARQTTRIVT